MNDATRRLEAHAAIAKLGEAHRAADRSHLFRTGDHLARIQRDYIRFKDLGEEKPGMARRLVGRIEHAEETLAEEHGDVGSADRAEWRARRGLIAVCALFAAQAVNLAMQILKPDEFGFVPDSLRGYTHRALAAALLALAAFPVKDFIFSYRFGKAKEMAEGALGEVKKELLASIGSEKVREGARARHGAE